MKTSTRISCFLFLLISAVGFSQDFLFRKIIIDFKQNYTNGDIKNLYDLAPLLNVTALMDDNLGYHFDRNEVKYVAARTFRENILFPETINLDSITNSKEYLTLFLDENKSRLSFSKLINAYIIEDLQSFKSDYELKEKSTEGEDFEIKSETSLSFDDINIDIKNFEKRVDFLGAILKNTNQSDHYNIIPIVLIELIKTKDPKSLLYIGSEPFRFRHKYNNHNYNEQYYEIINAFTDNSIALKDEKDNFTIQLSEDDYYNIKSKNYLFYWIHHYQDYSWDDEKGFFVNQKESSQQLSELELNFQKLYSSDNKIARIAFDNVLENDVAKVDKLLGGYKFENYGEFKKNDTLPMFFNRRLLNLTKLTSFYKSENVNYKVDSALNKKIRKIKNLKTYKDRIQYEDRLISELSFNEITRLEHFLSKEDHYKNYRNGINNSLARVFDIYYTNNFDQIIENEHQLRQYMKKAALFDKFGIIGSQNNYLLKFKGISETQKEQLLMLLRKETDKEIKLQILSVLSLVETKNGFVDFNRHHIDVIKNQDENSKKSRFFINEKLTDAYKGERIYWLTHEPGSQSNTLQLKENEILDLYEFTGGNFNLENTHLFFQEKLIAQDTLSELDFNRVLCYKGVVDNKLCIDNISKLKKGTGLGNIGFSELNDEEFTESLKFVKDFDEVSYLVDLYKDIMPIDALDLYFQYAKKADDKVDFCNYLIRYSRFLEFLEKEPLYLSTQKEEKIIELLTNQIKTLEEDSYDFESLSEGLFLFENRRKSLKEKLSLALKISNKDLKEDVVFKIFLSTKSTDVPEVLKIIEDFYDDIINRTTEDIVLEILGIPLDDYDVISITQARKKYNELGREKYFESLVVNHYPDIKKAGKLDYEKVYQILSYDNVLGFIGGQGGDRNKGVYSVIRLLEEKFKTDLDFQYSIHYIDVRTTTRLQKRCIAWKNFLKQKHVVPQELKYYSFSDEE